MHKETAGRLVGETNSYVKFSQIPCSCSVPIASSTSTSAPTTAHVNSAQDYCMPSYLSLLLPAPVRMFECGFNWRWSSTGFGSLLSGIWSANHSTDLWNDGQALCEVCRNGEVLSYDHVVHVASLISESWKHNSIEWLLWRRQPD